MNDLCGGYVHRKNKTSFFLHSITTPSDHVLALSQLFVEIFNAIRHAGLMLNIINLFLTFKCYCGRLVSYPSHCKIRNLTDMFSHEY